MRKRYIWLWMCSCIGSSLLVNTLHAQTAVKDTVKYTQGAYSYRSLDNEILERSPEYDVAKALYGKIPGLVVRQGIGTSSNNISSLSLNGQSPLVIIDGFSRKIGEVTIAEIESITVLKDATATAIYGVEGANGVVLITTKRGNEAKFKVTADYQYGVKTMFRAPEFADAYTHSLKLNEALILDGLPARYDDIELEAFKTGRYKNYFPNVDWMDEIYRDYGTNHQLNLTFSGGDKKFRYFTVVDYMRDRALYDVQTNDDRYDPTPTDTRVGVRGNVDVNLTGSTEMSLGVMARISEENRAYVTGIESVIYRTPASAFAVRNDDGSYGGSTLYGDQNPVALMNEKGSYRVTESTVLANLNLKQDLSAIVKGLSAEMKIGFDYLGAMVDVVSKSYSYTEVVPTILEDGTLVTEQKKYGKDSQTLSHNSWFNDLEMRTTFQTQLNYVLTHNRHSLLANAIYKQQAFTVSGRNNSIKRQSVLGTLKYNYANRYFIDGAVNYSGTAFLADGEKYSLYPAISGGWVVSNEGFLKESNTLSFLKVFGSYGLSGNDGNLRHELHVSSYGSQNTGDYYFTKNVAAFWGQAEGDLAAQGLTPEESCRYSVGFETRFFNDRLSLYADYFNEERTGILIEATTVSDIIGIGVGPQSVGAQNYQGVDFSIGLNGGRKDFKYSLYGNGTYLISELVNSNQAYQPHDYLYHKGNQVGQYYGLEVVGIFQNEYEINNHAQQTFGEVKPGDLKYKDQNGDNRIDDYDRVKMFGSSMPKFYFGFGMNMSYKRFEVSADFQGMTGVTANLLNSPLYKPMVDNGNISETFLSREVTWSPETAETATMPRLTTLANDNNYRQNSLWFQDGSFIKLRNVMIAYTIPKRIVRIADLKVYVQGTDLFSFDNLDFADPEQLGASYPSTRGFWVGAKLNF